MAVVLCAGAEMGKHAALCLLRKNRPELHISGRLDFNPQAECNGL
jgi:hypothetical protein